MYDVCMYFDMVLVVINTNLMVSRKSKTLYVYYYIPI